MIPAHDPEPPLVPRAALLKALIEVMKEYKDAIRSEFETSENREPWKTTQWKRWAKIVRNAGGKVP
jgi:hypothetical protein